MANQSIDRGVAVCGRIFAFTGGAIVLFIAVLVTAEVIARNVFGGMVFHAFELSTYLFAAAVSFGLAHTLIVGGNIRLDVVYQVFPKSVQRLLDLAALALMTGVGAFLARFAWRLVMSNYERGVASATGLAIPLAVPQAIWATGITAFALTAAWLTFRHGMALLRKDLALADEIGSMGTNEGSDAVAQAERT